MIALVESLAKCRVVVSEIRPDVTADLPLDTKQRTRSPISAMLISGRHSQCWSIRKGAHSLSRSPPPART